MAAVVHPVQRYGVVDLALGEQPLFQETLLKAAVARRGVTGRPTSRKEYTARATPRGLRSLEHTIKHATSVLKSCATPPPCVIRFQGKLARVQNFCI